MKHREIELLCTHCKGANVVLNPEAYTVSPCDCSAGMVREDAAHGLGAFLSRAQSVQGLAALCRDRAVDASREAIQHVKAGDRERANLATLEAAVLEGVIQAIGNLCGGRTLSRVA